MKFMQPVPSTRENLWIYFVSELSEKEHYEQV